MATVLFSAGIGFYSSTLLKQADRPQESQLVARIVDDLTYVKEAIRMIFENETMILMYLKLVLKKQGIPLD
jgi:hypothetical protein